MPVQTEQQRQNTFTAAGQQPAAQPAPAPAATPAPATPAPQATPATSPIQNPVPATSLTPTTAPTLPQPTAPTVQANYFGGVANDVQSTQNALQTAYQQQSDQISSQLDTLKTQQQNELNAEQQLEQPFNATLEQTQEQQFGVNSNYQKNQALADELNSIVNEATTQLGSGSTRFASNATIKASQSNTISALTARAGLIQSAMSAYNGQISAAYTQIDRAVAAINADNTDQLNYYQTLLSLNSSDQLTLTDEQKTNVANQISTLQKQAADAQTTADNIKQAMLDPTTAQAYAQAGVTLTDTPEQINQKLSDYGYSQELATQSSQMAQKGFSPVLPGQSAPAGTQVVTLEDSRGNTKQYYDSSGHYISAYNPATGTSDALNTITGQFLNQGNAVSTGGTTTAQANGGVLAGYDLGNYATNPTNVQQVTNIYNSIPDSSAAGLSQYIQNNAPGSPITGQMIIDAANKEGVDPKLMAAILNNESAFGTLGAGANTFNPGNVGNTDNGTTVNMGSWQAGLDALAQNLAGRQIDTAGLSQQYNVAFNDVQAAAFSKLPEGVKRGVAGLLNGTTPITTWSTRASTSGQSQAQMIAYAQSVDPTFDATAAKAGQTFETAASTQQFIANANTADNTVQKIIDLSNKVNRSNLTLLNNGELAFKHATSDQNAANMLTTYNLLSDELGKVLGSGQGSDFAIQLGQKLIDPTLSQSALQGQANLVSNRIANKLYEYKQQFNQGTLGTAASATTSTTKSGTPFDIAGARAAGYSDAEIQAYLAAN